GAGGGGAVFGVVEGAAVEREAAAADAAVEAVAHSFEQGDPGFEAVADSAADRLPVLARGGAAEGEAGELFLDLAEGEAEALGYQGEGQAADVGAQEAALVAGGADGREQALRLVEADGGDGEAGAAGEFADGE